MLTQKEMQQTMWEDYLKEQELLKLEDEKFKDCTVRSSVDELFCLNDKPHNCPLS